MADQKVVKVKKKRWVEVVSPQLFRNEIIGEIPVFEPRTLEGKLMTVNLMTLTKDMKRQNASIKFLLTSVKGDKASTETYGYYLSPTSMRRMVRRGKEKIGFSAVYMTADNKRIRIMPVIIPVTKVKGSVAAAYRKHATNFFFTYASKVSFDEMIRDLITTKLQKELKNELKKIYPVKILEVAKLHIENKKVPVEVSKAVEPQPEEEAEEQIEPAKEETAEPVEEQ